MTKRAHFLRSQTFVRAGDRFFPLCTQPSIIGTSGSLHVCNQYAVMSVKERHQRYRDNPIPLFITDKSRSIRINGPRINMEKRDPSYVDAFRIYHNRLSLNTKRTIDFPPRTSRRAFVSKTPYANSGFREFYPPSNFIHRADIRSLTETFGKACSPIAGVFFWRQEGKSLHCVNP